MGRLTFNVPAVVREARVFWGEFDARHPDNDLQTRVAELIQQLLTLSHIVLDIFERWMRGLASVQLAICTP